MIEANGEDEEGDSGDEGKEAEPTTECPAHKPALKTPKGALTDTEVFANSIGFLAAGNVTTAVTLSFVSYELALHPEVQENLQSEIDAYFENKPVSGKLIIWMYCNSESFHTFHVFNFTP